MKRTSGKRWISLVLALCLCLLVGCGGKQTGYDPLKGVETRMITDSAGRQVEIPAEITRIAPSGSTAQMILMPVAVRRQLNDLPDELWTKINIEFYKDSADAVFKALVE